MWLSVWIGHLWSSFKYGCSSLGKLCKVVIKKKQRTKEGKERTTRKNYHYWIYDVGRIQKLFACANLWVSRMLERIVNLREESNLVHGIFTACVLVPQQEWSTNTELKTNIGPNNLNVNARSIFRSLEVFSNNDAVFLLFLFSSSFFSAYLRAKSNRIQHRPSATRF